MLTTFPASRDDRPAVARALPLPLLRTVAAAAGRVQTWAASAEARCRTRRALQDLDRLDWQVAHDVRLPGVDHIDHIAAGPSGVYLFASRAWNGTVTVDHKGATITPERDPGAAWTARGPHRSLPPAASAVARALSAPGGRPVSAPRAVVVVWAPFPERVTVCAGISYVAGEHLVEWLAGQPARSEAGRPVVLPHPRSPVGSPLSASPRSAAG